MSSRGEDELLADHCIAFEERRTISGGDGWYQPKQLERNPFRFLSRRGSSAGSYPQVSK